jgi:hypothetical protein
VHPFGDRCRYKPPPSLCQPPPPHHPQDDDISGVVRYRTYEVLKAEANNPRLRWAYLPYSMHMAGPREAIQHMIIRKNYGEGGGLWGCILHLGACSLHAYCPASYVPTFSEAG